MRSNPGDQNPFALVLPGRADAAGHPERALLCAAGRVSLVSRSKGRVAALGEDLLLEQHLCCSFSSRVSGTAQFLLAMRCPGAGMWGAARRAQLPSGLPVRAAEGTEAA